METLQFLMIRTTYKEVVNYQRLPKLPERTSTACDITVEQAIAKNVMKEMRPWLDCKLGGMEGAPVLP